MNEPSDNLTVHILIEKDCSSIFFVPDDVKVRETYKNLEDVKNSIPEAQWEYNKMYEIWEWKDSYHTIYEIYERKIR